MGKLKKKKKDFCDDEKKILIEIECRYVFIQLVVVEKIDLLCFFWRDGILNLKLSKIVMNDTFYQD